MGKTAAGDKTTTSADANIEQTFSTLQAKQQFFTSAISMSWQLALTIIIPVVAGKGKMVAMAHSLSTRRAVSVRVRLLIATAQMKSICLLFNGCYSSQLRASLYPMVAFAGGRRDRI